MEHQYASFGQSYIFFQITEKRLLIYIYIYIYLWSMKYMGFLLSLYSYRVESPQIHNVKI